MRRIAIPFLVLVLIVSTGCGITPKNRWAQARSTLTATTSGLTEAAKAGFLSDRDIVTTDVIVKSARRALEVAETQLPEGSESFNDYLDITDAVIEKLITLLMKAKE